MTEPEPELEFVDEPGATASASSSDEEQALFDLNVPSSGDESGSDGSEDASDGDGPSSFGRYRSDYYDGDVKVRGAHAAASAVGR